MSLLLYLPYVLIGLVSLIYLFFTRTFNYWKKKNVVGPKPTVLFGNLKDSALRRKFIGEVVKEIYDKYPNEKLVGIYRMTTPTLLIRDLDLIRTVFIKDFDLWPDRGLEFSKKGLGSNMFHADGESWRILRSTFSPLFTSSKLKNMTYLIAQYANKHVDHIEHLCSQDQEMEVKRLTRNYTISTTSATAFGMDTEIEDNLFKIITEIDKLTLEANYGIELDMTFPGILTKLESSLFPKKVIDFFYSLSRNAINERNGEPTGRNDFMDLILAMRKEGEISKLRKDKTTATLTITEDVIAAQAFVFFVAGYETSATTMAFILYELAKNPDVQDKLIAEIDRELQKSDGKLTYDSVTSITYLDQVISEALRLHTIVETHALQRIAVADYTFPGTDVTVPKGTMIYVSASGIHYDEKYYPNPHIFQPERFSPEEVKNRHPCAFLGFGAGPRNCIGMRLGKLQTMMFIAKLLSRFRVEPCKRTPETIKYDPKRLLRSPCDLHLRFVPRYK